MEERDSDGVTFVAFLTGTHVAAKTSAHPPITIDMTSVQGRIKSTPCSSQAFLQLNTTHGGPSEHSPAMLTA